jgi:acetyl esterase
MPGSDEKPAVDAIMLKVLQAVPFQLSLDGGVQAARKRLRDLPRREVFPEMRVEDHTIDAPEGPIAIRVYWPLAAEARPPMVVFFHGGGWAVGDLDTHDGIARAHAAVAGAVVVSVDYRLAPEHPYPAAVDDAWVTTRWVAANGGNFGADPTRLAVAGDSAGGSLAAVISQLARDNGGPPIAFQLLWYPGTTWDTSLASFTENAHAPVLGTEQVKAFSRIYAPNVDMSDPPATLVPAHAADLTGLPPAYIAVAGHDPLRDDGMRYGQLLAAAGVPVEVHNAETLIHGYVGYAGVVPAATDAVNRGLQALRAALRGT